MWPKPLPNHWRIGSAIGVGVDTQDHIWIIHRGGATLDRKEKYAETMPPSADCCTSAPPVLEFDQEGNMVHAWGGPGPGYRVARQQPRHHGRQQGHRLDRRQRRDRRPDPEVHQGRQVRQAVRVRVRGRRQQRPVGLQPRRQDLPRRAEQRGVHLRRLRQQARRGHRHGDAARSSGIGARTATSRTTGRSVRTTLRRRSRSSSAIRCTAPSWRTTAWCTSAIA